jgi:serine phosphatase RsbU (regulator of sigma subunit)
LHELLNVGYLQVHGGFRDVEQCYSLFYCRRRGATCTVLGLFEKWDCTMEERELAPGDAVLLYTDGVTEALNGEGEEFGEERLLEAARQHHELSLPELLASVADQARRFSPHEQTDDITLIVAKCT